MQHESRAFCAALVFVRVTVLWVLLGLFAQKLEDKVADDRGADGDKEIGWCDDVLKGHGEGLAASGRYGKLTHQKV
jgi:hypothetical protein